MDERKPSPGMQKDLEKWIRLRSSGWEHFNKGEFVSAQSLWRKAEKLRRRILRSDLKEQTEKRSHNAAAH